MVSASGRRKSVDDPQQFETSPFPPDQCSRHINPLREILDVTQYLVVDFGEPENYLVGDIARCIATHVRASRIERDEAQRLMNLHYQRGDQNSPHALRVSKTGGVSTGSAPSRLRLALSQLITRLKTPDAEGEKHHYPKLRNFVLDVLSEGRQKNIIQVLFEADIGGVKDRLAEHRLRTGESVTITSYVAKCFVAAIAADKRMQA